MPKLKTHSGCKKRFKLTSSGKIKRACANTNHNAGTKSRKQKNRLQQGGYVDAADARVIKKLLPHKKG